MKIIDKLTLWLVRKNIRRNRKLRVNIHKELISYFGTEYCEDTVPSRLYFSSAELFSAAKEMPNLGLNFTSKNITMLEAGVTAELYDALNDKAIQVD